MKELQTLWSLHFGEVMGGESFQHKKLFKIWYSNLSSKLDLYFLPSLNTKYKFRIEDFVNWRNGINLKIQNKTGIRI